VLGVVNFKVMIIVLETTGKNESVDSVKVKLFESLSDAEFYCIENTDNPMDMKYWTYCEIVKDGVQYEVARYHNYA